MGSVAQLWPTLCDPIDCSSPGSSVDWIFQARILEWLNISFYSGQLPYDPDIPLQGISPKKMITLIWKRYTNPNIHSLQYCLQQSRCGNNLCLSMDGSLKMIWYTHTLTQTNSGILLSGIKKEFLTHVTTSMDLEGIMLIEISQVEKDKYCMISLICEI